MTTQVKLTQETLMVVAEVAAERGDLLKAINSLRHAPDMQVTMQWGDNKAVLKANVALAALEARHEELRAVLRQHGIEVNGH